MKKILLLMVFTSLLAFNSIFGGTVVKAEDKALLIVTASTTVKAYVVADGTFANGWLWTIDVTVPSDETVIQMKFADLASALGNISAKDNIQFYSNQSTNAYDSAHPIIIRATNTYSDPMFLATDTSGDLSSALGKQIRVTINARAPVGSDASAYSMNYGILSNTEAAVVSTINKPPVASSRYIAPSTGALAHYFGDDLRIPIADILATASDPDGDVLHLTSVSSPSGRGGAVVTIDGTNILYHPTSAVAIDQDNFTYTIDDAKGGIATGVVVVVGTARQ